MALQPVGPLPASTYWRRRVLLAVAAIAALVVVLRACTADDGTGTLAGGAGPTPSPSASSAVPSPTAAGPSAAPSPTAVPACGDAVLQVTVVADAVEYRKGSAPRFTLTVTNVGPRACRRALGAGAVELRVFSGEDRIWSSDDCSKSTGQGILALEPKEARALVVQWPGKRTRPGCKTGEVAQPGTYRVSARVGDIVRQGSVFRIEG